MTTPEDAARYLIERGLTIAIAESCTGGLMSYMLSSNPGISAAFWGSVVAYSNQAKQDVVGVPEAIIKDHGAVSAQNAEAMASSIRQRSETDIGMGITGIAGPGGGTTEKPVGLVFIAVATKGGLSSRQHNLSGSRAEIQAGAAEAAFELVLEVMRNQKL